MFIILSYHFKESFEKKIHYFILKMIIYFCNLGVIDQINLKHLDFNCFMYTIVDYMCCYLGM